MKRRLTVARVAFFIAALAFVLVAVFPLRLALDWLGLEERGLAAREATGTIWFGALKEAQLGPVPLGDLETRLHAAPLLLGRARISLTRDDEADPFRGAVTASRHAFGIDDVSGQLRLGNALAPLPIGQIELNDVSAGFESGLCSRGEGQVRAILSGDAAALGLPAALTGNVRCAGDALLLGFAGPAGMERLQFRLFSDGRYRGDLSVRVSDTRIGQRLGAAGFRIGGQGFVRIYEGRF